MLSIICPTYNSMETINDLIDSMLNQKSIKNNLEIIFIDDGSTDKTVKLLEKGILKLQNNKYKASLYKSEHNDKDVLEYLTYFLSFLVFWTHDQYDDMCSKMIFHNYLYRHYIYNEW